MGSPGVGQKVGRAVSAKVLGCHSSEVEGRRTRNRVVRGEVGERLTDHTEVVGNTWIRTLTFNLSVIGRDCKL